MRDSPEILCRVGATLAVALVLSDTITFYMKGAQGQAMWTSTMEHSPRRVLLTGVLGQFWPGAYFSSFAPLQVQNLPRQTLPAHDWIRVRNRLAGISESDLNLIYADGNFRVAPAALPAHERTFPGLEVVGEVIEVREGVQRVRVGDRVALQYGQNCVSQGVQPLCRSCAAGEYSLCEHGSFSGPEQFGGGWSEEMLLHESQVFRVPNELTDEQAVLIEPSAVALHAVLRRLPQAGENVLVVGAGTMGLLVLQVVRALAPQAKVSVLAHHAFQVEQATRLGADHIIYPENTYQDVQQATGAKLYKGMFGNTMLLGGYDVIYDTIGTKRTIHNALRWARAGGAVVVIGKALHMMRIDLTPLWYQEVSLIGSLDYGTEQWPIGSQDHYATFAIAAELIAQGLLHPEKLITHHFALTNFREAISTAAGKAHTRSIEVVFDYALMPASVVPNVRASARPRRPARPRTSVGDTRETQGQQPQQLPQPQPPQPSPEPEQEQEGEWERMGIPSMPTGATWSQTVQPLPAPALPADSGSESGQEQGAEETIPQHLLALTGATETGEPQPAPTGEPAAPAADDPLTMMFDLPQAATGERAAPVMEYEQQYAVTEEPATYRQREPQPILLPTPAQTAPDAEPTETSQQGEIPTTPPTRTGRTRARPHARKPADTSSATNEAPDTL
jgi:2-desacetyl-2-hydroxyethyl bacteriochlorophyllide A dehydrogenase